mmetsp:Transcript_19508/g.46586  ORF Transcript_19508/g.46586 Transcript_19508/m.46586 type:complete len:133 (-) Transcript_19508:275-673(-)
MTETYPEVRVLEQMMKDGTFDELRQKVVKELKQKDGLKEYTKQKVQEKLGEKRLEDLVTRLQASSESSASRSKVQQEIVQELRSSLEMDLLNEISSSTWELLSTSPEIADQIQSRVHDVFLSVVAPSLGSGR